MKERKIQKPSAWKNIRLALVSLVLIMGLWFALDQLDQKKSLIRQARLISSPPLRVRITNVHPRGFTVTWFTAEKTTGKVIHSENKEVSDERGENKLLFSHSVKVLDLQPGKKYYFKIISGGKTYLKSVSESWQETGVAESVELPAEDGDNTIGAFSQEDNAFSLSRFRPNPIYGQVIREDKTTAEEAIVFLEIPGRSNLLSAVADREGKWVIEMANLKKKDFSGSLAYLPGVELLKISAKERPNDEGISYQAIPAVTTNLNESTNPVTLSLLTLPAPLVRPTNTPQPSPTRPPQPAGAFNFETKFQGAGDGTGPVNANLYFVQNGKTSFSGKIKLSPQGKGIFSGKYVFYKTGTFNFFIKPEGYLKKNLGAVSLGRGEISKSFLEEIILAGDLNNDNEINCLDVSILVGQINTPPKTTSADFDNDGTVTIKDLSILTANYLKKGD